jgi:hypothetical protein
MAIIEIPFTLVPSVALKLSYLFGCLLRRNLGYSGFVAVLDLLVPRLVAGFAAGLQNRPDPHQEEELD